MRPSPKGTQRFQAAQRGLYVSRRARHRSSSRSNRAWSTGSPSNAMLLATWRGIRRSRILRCSSGGSALQRFMTSFQFMVRSIRRRRRTCKPYPSRIAIDDQLGRRNFAGARKRTELGVHVAPSVGQAPNDRSASASGWILFGRRAAAGFSARAAGPTRAAGLTRAAVHPIDALALHADVRRHRTRRVGVVDAVRLQRVD